MYSTLTPACLSPGNARATSTVAGAHDTSVTSVPCWRTTALPIGTSYASSGTSGCAPDLTSG